MLVSASPLTFDTTLNALVDWSIVFEAEDVATGADETAPVFTLWDNLLYPTVHLFVYIPAALLILRVNRGGWPKWIERLALRLKLVEA
jgi:hypothetical protein